jgi:DNA phosphorothioation-dependent restriction protein DptG
MGVNNNFTKQVINVIVTILSLVLVAGMSWVSKSLMDAKAEILVLRAEIAAIKESIKMEVTDLKERMTNKTSDRYRRKDAEKDLNRVEEQLKEIRARLRYLEGNR